MVDPAADSRTAEEAQYTGYPVQIYCFSGPLDLLLHLVRRHELDIAEIPVAEITTQYLEYLQVMEEVQVEVSGEFLVTASALSYLKSKTLLPPDPEEEEEGLEEEDPAVELQRRLREYQVYKEAADRLESAKQVRERIFLRPTEEGTGLESGYVPLEEVSLFDMLGAVNELLKRAEPDPVGRVVLSPVTVPGRIEEVLLRLHAERGEVGFGELVGTPVRRVVIIVTFLALLELIRRQEVEVRQESIHGALYVSLSPAEHERDDEEGAGRAEEVEEEA
jgi:segregation and condensation protein A